MGLFAEASNAHIGLSCIFVEPLLEQPEQQTAADCSSNAQRVE